MNKRPDMEKKVNEALESLEGIQRAEPAPFLFTRVKARLEREQHNVWETAGSLIARPAIAFAGLFLVLCVNVYILFEKNSTTTTADQSSANFQNTMLVEEYALTASNNNYDYENIEP